MEIKEQIELLKQLKLSGVLTDEINKELDDAILNMVKSIQQNDRLPVRFTNK